MAESPLAPLIRYVHELAGLQQTGRADALEKIGDDAERLLRLTQVAGDQ